jgi:uncharacterized protein YraI
LVLCEIGGCARGSSNVDSKYVRGLVWFYSRYKQCSKRFGQIFPRFYYYLKHLKHM